ncbi:hypothetical protein BPNPMPFG_004014 [Mesorhizobium sp. AR07]|uniref:hypothetical protein n=1 Tax=Mesorhizobium sp. AR07 TaxID=2865838 RepID=UPI0021602B0B|nr:hypothetical protein [Mesorhizobium sp. AR07]UVK42343.1 hypothetical protein BPNPMPFG_004014 [Mesorhizobium sp. AR07]
MRHPVSSLHLSKLAFSLVGAAALVATGSLVARADGAPGVSPGFTLSTFVTPPAGSSKPDSLALIDGNVWIGYANGGKPDGSDGGMSQIVQYSLDGKVLRTLSVKGHNDGLKLNPATKKIWALQNEDGDANLVVIDPVSGAMENYTFEAGKHGGGYDDVAFKNGEAFISASAPQVDGGKTNPGPSIVTAKLTADHKVVVAAAFAGAPNVTDIATGDKETLNLTDPDSLTIAPSGDLVMTSQDDSELLFVHKTSTSGGEGKVLHLMGGVKVDDTTFVGAKHGFLLVADTPANIVYKIEAANWGVGTAYSAMSGVDATKVAPAIPGYVGLLDVNSGALLPVTTNMQAPHGMIFVSGK